MSCPPSLRKSAFKEAAVVRIDIMDMTNLSPYMYCVSEGNFAKPVRAIRMHGYILCFAR